jgi:D-aminoacyl-tRNA deacylase
MRAVIQRVREARVEVKGNTVGAIGSGLLILLGVGGEDATKDCEYMASKVAHLRIFSDEQGRMNRSLMDVHGAALVVSQFTLWGDCRKGRRPSFVGAAPPDHARALYERFVSILRETGLAVATGRFQEMMEVYLVNDGPVTLLLDTEKEF